MIMREAFSDFIKELQDKICSGREALDGGGKFIEDSWQRAEGGGGITRVIQNGKIFEKGGVNTSEVYGKLTPLIREQLKIEGEEFFACGISLGIHPQSPMVPTVHANYRYFEVYDNTGAVKDCWFGGGADLTPYYLFDEDAVLFHKCHKESCDKFNAEWYQKFKTQCDNYFVNHHRNGERRGIGGIFYDYQRPTETVSADKWLEFAKSNGEAFMRSYFAIVEKRKSLSYTDEQKHWQLIRRGRYVEFNLIHDRGPIFGLQSNGRTESILMSLPMNVRFEYNYQPAPGSEEERLQKILLTPVNWV